MLPAGIDPLVDESIGSGAGNLDERVIANSTKLATHNHAHVSVEHWDE
jgi:hypothetical protein